MVGILKLLSTTQVCLQVCRGHVKWLLNVLIKVYTILYVQRVLFCDVLVATLLCRLGSGMQSHDTTTWVQFSATHVTSTCLQTLYFGSSWTNKKIIFIKQCTSVIIFFFFFFFFAVMNSTLCLCFGTKWLNLCHKFIALLQQQASNWVSGWPQNPENGPQAGFKRIKIIGQVLQRGCTQV